MPLDRKGYTIDKNGKRLLPGDFVLTDLGQGMVRHIWDEHKVYVHFPGRTTLEEFNSADIEKTVPNFAKTSCDWQVEWKQYDEGEELGKNWYVKPSCKKSVVYTLSQMRNLTICPYCKQKIRLVDEKRNPIIKEAKAKEHQPTICIDMDGVIAKKIEGSKIGPPLEGSQDFLLDLIDLGWKVVIFTCRPKKMVEAYMEQYGLDYSEINENSSMKLDSPKPIADIYLDDRGLTFEGNYKDTLEKILEFKPWWED
jgi:glutaredoxin